MPTTGATPALTRDGRAFTMPKEVVQYPSTDQHSGTEISIHWQKDGAHVQMGVTRHVWTPPAPDAVASTPHGDHSACAACVDAKTQNAQRREFAGQLLGMRVMDSTANAGPAVGDFDPPVTVFTEALSRGDINRMIRVLRRARDQAYGRDE